MDVKHLHETLAPYLQEFELSLAPLQEQHIVDFLLLLMEWNQKFNLTAIRDFDKMITHHIIDSLSIIPYLTEGRRIIDVGSGGGFPGIPLAIAKPEINVTLLDSSHKKTNFLRSVCENLLLNNAQVITERAEKYEPRQLFDVIVTRAFSSLVQMVKYTRHLVTSSGIFLAMKGKYPHDELKALPKNIVVLDIKKLSVSDLLGDRHLVILKKC